VITLVQRYLAEGNAGLAPRSRRPLTGPQRTTQELEDEVIAIRKDFDKNGHEAGAATIAFHLELRHGTSPAVSTICLTGFSWSLALVGPCYLWHCSHSASNPA
jgi:hypothetical protein